MKKRILLNSNLLSGFTMFSLLFVSFASLAFQDQSNIILEKYSINVELDCGNFRTQTMGGWGSNAAGNNPGVYRDMYFDSAFPNGLSIGCDYTLTLTSASAVQSFLPSGSTASAFTENLIDPSNYSNVLAGQLVALTLSIGFDENDADFSGSDINLGDLLINSGPFIGFTVYELIEEANQFIGGCPSEYFAIELNEVLTSINENFDDGISDNGFLDCPDDTESPILCALNLDDVNAFCFDENNYSVEITVSGYNATYIVEDINASSGSGQYICLGDPSDINALTSYTFILSYPIANNYSASVYALIPSIDNCSEAINNDECVINDISGSAPICCDFSITCPPNTQFVFSCIEEIPAADTSIISYQNNCGPVTINVLDQTSGSGCTSNPLYLTRTYTVYDGTTTLNCVYNYIVIDNMPPLISCPSSENAECSAIEMIPLNWATAIDNCDTDVDISYVNMIGESCDSFVRVWTAVDNCGNSASCNQTVYITDTTAPTLVLPNDITLNCGSETLPSITGMASASDACSYVTISYIDGDLEGDNCFASFTRVWTATDACGNSVSDEQIISIEDNVGPVLIGIPGNMNQQCGEIPEPPLVVAFDVCQDDSVTVLFNEVIYGQGCQKAVFRTWTAIDSCGNSSSITRSIYVNDTQGPVITCPDDVVLNCGDPVPDPSESGSATAFDNCSGDNVTINHLDGNLTNDCPPKIHRIWTATDTCGNVSSCVQIISFIDNLAPVISCVDDITVNCAFGDITPPFTGTPTVTDDCSNYQLLYSDGVYSGDCPYSFTRTWTAMDACGNFSSCQQVITVIDESGPTIYCPPTKSVSCGSSMLPSVTGMAAAYDNCSTVSISYTDGEIEGSCPQSFIRTWTASDYCGNTSSCEQIINIIDNTAPVIVCPPTINIDCGSGDYSTDITGIPEVSDQCNSDVTLSYIETPIQGDCPKYFYRIWTAMDECQNTSQCYQMINIIDTTAPELICPEDITISCSEDPNPEITGFAFATDDCSSFEITYSDSITLSETIGGSDDCGQYRTQTQGGWGSVAHGGNPGTYRDNHFDLAFPNGLSIGCDRTLDLTSSLAVQNFLPSGGTPLPLPVSMINPVGYGNTLAGQIVALGLSIGFDNYDEDFSEATGSLANLIVADGMFAGWTVGEIYEEANRFIGVCGSNYSANDLNHVVSSINENFVDGNIDNRYLICDEENTNCFTIYRTWTAIDACGNLSTCVQVISADNSEINPISLFETYSIAMSVYPSPTLGKVSISTNIGIEKGDIIEIFDISGMRLISYIVSDPDVQVVDLSNLNSGIYIVKWTNNIGTISERIIKN